MVKAFLHDWRRKGKHQNDIILGSPLGDAKVLTGGQLAIKLFRNCNRVDLEI